MQFDYFNISIYFFTKTALCDTLESRLKEGAGVQGRLVKGCIKKVIQAFAAFKSKSMSLTAFSACAS